MTPMTQRKTKPYYVTRINEIPLVHVSKIAKMELEDFGPAADFIIAWETNGDPWFGGFNDLPDDKGGPTKFGIAQNFHPEVDVKNLTLDGALTIYEADYWAVVRHYIPPQARLLRSVMVEALVNGGGGTRALQSLCHARPDGVFGPKTKLAIKTMLDIDGAEEALIPRWYEQRKLDYTMLANRDATQKKWLKGWLHRVDDSRGWYEDVLAG